MTIEINDLLQKRGNLVKNMTDLIEKAEKEGRDLNAEEKSQYEQMDKDQSDYKARADRLHNASNLKNELGELNGKSVRSNPSESVKNKFATDDYKNGFDAYARRGNNGINSDIYNALQVGTNSEGGFIVPEEFETMLIAKLQDINAFRPLVNTIRTASDRNIPVESSIPTATWTAEEAAYTESDPVFARVTLSAYKLGVITKVSEELLQDSFFDVQSYLADAFAKAFGIAEESAIVNGDGSGKPTGILGGTTANVNLAGAAAITSDELIDIYHTLSRPYRANATWLFNDSTVKLIRKLKDGDNQYLWQPGLQAGQPDTLLSRPIVASTAMPAATTGLESICFGDMRSYTIADRSNRVMQRLNELYAANGQVGFRMYERLDGKVTDANGLVKATQA